MTHGILPMLVTLGMLGVGVLGVVRAANTIEEAAVGVAELNGGDSA